jgi:hypothetical protein
MNYLDILRTYDDMRDLNKQAFRMEQVYHFKLDPYIQYYDYDLCDEKSDDEYDSTAEGTNPYSASVGSNKSTDNLNSMNYMQNLADAVQKKR